MVWVSVGCPACGAPVEVDVEETNYGTPHYRAVQYKCECMIVGADAEKFLRDIVESARDGWALDFIHMPGYNEYLLRSGQEYENRWESLKHVPFSEEERVVLDRWDAVITARDGLARVLKVVPSPDQAPGLIKLTQRGMVTMSESHGAVPVYRVLSPGLRYQQGVVDDWKNTRGGGGNFGSAVDPAPA